MYCHPEKYIHEWWVVEAELLPSKHGLNHDDSAVVVDGAIPMFDVGDGKPEKLVLLKGQRKCYYKWRTKTGKVKTGMATHYSMYQLDAESGTGTWHSWYDLGMDHPHWIKDPLLVAMKAAEVRDI